MSARVQLASEFVVARNGYDRGGRLLVTPAGVSGFMWDYTPSFPNWGYSVGTIAANEKLTRAALLWLTGKSSGVKVMIYQQSAETSWGLMFRDFVTRTDNVVPACHAGATLTGEVGLSGTVTVAGTTHDQGRGTGWNTYDGSYHAFDPLDYDVILMDSVDMNAAGPSQIDTYLQARGSIWGLTSLTAGTRWNRYGFTIGSGHQVYGVPSPALVDFLCQPITCAPLGDGTFQYGIYTSTFVAEGTNTIGGTSSVYGLAVSSTLPAGTVFWETLGLWTST